MFAILNRKLQSLGGWTLEIITDWRNTWLPLIILMITFSLASYGTWWTFISLAFLPITLNLVRKRFNVQDGSHFYYAFTLYSAGIANYVFESITHGTFASVTRFEYLLCLFLSFSSVSSILWAKQQGSKYARTPPISPTTSGGLIRAGIPKFTDEMGRVYQNYDYCKKCRKCLTRRDHHCVWLNMCVGKVNKASFMAGMVCGTAWLMLTIMMNLTSICYPVYFFDGTRLNDGSSPSSSSTTSRWLLVPTNCPDVYGEGQFSVTLAYITAIYGIGVALLLTGAIIHQLRLMYLGLTYVEYRRGISGNRVSPAAAATTTSEDIAPPTTNAQDASLPPQPPQPPYEAVPEVQVLQDEAVNGNVVDDDAGVGSNRIQQFLGKRRRGGSGSSTNKEVPLLNHTDLSRAK